MTTIQRDITSQYSAKGWNFRTTLYDNADARGTYLVRHCGTKRRSADADKLLAVRGLKMPGRQYRTPFSSFTMTGIVIGIARWLWQRKCHWRYLEVDANGQMRKQSCVDSSHMQSFMVLIMRRQDLVIDLKRVCARHVLRSGWLTTFW